MSAPSDRRGFLRGLATLPLIGGGVTLIGNPTAAAEPLSEGLLDAYSEWLHYERRLLCEERYAGYGARDAVPCNTGATGFHFPAYPKRWSDLPQPSSRAAIVLAAVGCDWRRP